MANQRCLRRSSLLYEYELRRVAQTALRTSTVQSLNICVKEIDTDSASFSERRGIEDVVCI
ncbi:hypothetical protein KIN20_011081 [Parelaphostrongylus tenuis]|uniref:Uncharacterized protein n=1 Tax=Parelaphostrongylus tenuis TaxID=148309 RepID=A0AAD5QLS9_PARTN|nr:hypothetical protein KIN20_011081 [Parelaphostrongylus tenuis]